MTGQFPSAGAASASTRDAGHPPAAGLPGPAAPVATPAGNSDGVVVDSVESRGPMPWPLSPSIRSRVSERTEIEAETSPEAEPISDCRAYTASIRSSILDYEYENGRRYHGYRKQGSYFLPNDEDESDRLDLFHHIMTLRCNGELHLAPIGPRPGRVLDLGTGTGIWAMDMGDTYPSAEILANDLSPIQPSAVPPNVHFEIDNFEEEWIYEHKFDYIHGRYLAGAVADWPRLMRQAYKFLQPGGWIEFQDFDMRFYTSSGEFRPDCAMARWSRVCAEGLREKFGLEPEPGPNLERWVREAGFVNVKHKVLPLPVGTWPKDRRMKEIGAYDMVQFLDGLESMSLRVFTAQGWSPDEIQVSLAEVRKDLKNRKLQAQHDFYVVYAQKPPIPQQQGHQAPPVTLASSSRGPPPPPPTGLNG